MSELFINGFPGNTSILHNVVCKFCNVIMNSNSSKMQTEVHEKLHLFHNSLQLFLHDACFLPWILHRLVYLAYSDKDGNSFCHICRNYSIVTCISENSQKRRKQKTWLSNLEFLDFAIQSTSQCKLSRRE